jgi:hypothetical protein
MSARTIKNPATVSGQGNLASDSLTLSNAVNCVLTSNATGNLLANGVPVGGGGGGAVDAVLAGDGISVATVGGDATVTNTGVLSIVAGTNITTSEAAGVVTINSTGGGGGGVVDSLIAGDGISVSGTTDVTVSNTGVLSIVAGDNITTSEAAGVVTINGAAGGGIVDSLIAGDGISVSGTTDVTVSNTGVLSIVAGTNITTSEAAGVVTINSAVNNNIGALRFFYTFPAGTTPQQIFNINNLSIPNFIGKGNSVYIMGCNGGGSDGPFFYTANFNQIVGTDTQLQISIKYIGTEAMTAQQFSVNFSVIAYNI